MKSLGLVFVLLVGLSAVTSMANGNVINEGKVNIEDLQEYGDLAEKALILEHISPDLHAVLSEGIDNMTLRFISAGQFNRIFGDNVSGDNLGGEKNTQHDLTVSEVLINLESYKALPKDEKLKLLIREGLLAGLNKFIKKRGRDLSPGNSTITYMNNRVKYYIFLVDENLPLIKNVIRRTADLIASLSDKALNNDHILRDIEKAGWRMQKDNSVICIDRKDWATKDLFSFIAEKIFLKPTTCLEMKKEAN